MTAVVVSEVTQGLVVHLETDELRKLGGCETNADRAPADRAVDGPHYFLIVEVDVAVGIALAAPLFSKWAPGSEALDENKKTGLSAHWRGQDSHYSHFQFWTIPIASIAAASVNEESAATDRRRYVADAKTFSNIAAWTKKNRNGFTKL